MKYFNLTGICVPGEHYMVDTSEKIAQIMIMIQRKQYFVINRPRQFGKTTTLSLLKRELLQTEDYLPISLSFEGIGDAPFRSLEAFGPKFLSYLGEDIYVKKYGYSNLFYEKIDTIDNFDKLSKRLAEIISTIKHKIVLMIDEVDKSRDNDIFIYFLGMLRDKFLKAQMQNDVTFHSVILAGLHDIKTLKLKIRPEAEKKYNSPWNIAVDFKIDMSFNPKEIATMLMDYSHETSNKMNIEEISEKIYFWTSGYPFLVSKLCKIVDEEIIPNRENKEWNPIDIDNAVHLLLMETNTLFDDLGKNLENNKDLYNFIESVTLGHNEKSFSMQAPLVNLAYMYGIITRSVNNKVQISNKIFNEVITNYIVSKMESENTAPISTTQEPYIKLDGRLDFEKVLLKFQEVIKEKYHGNMLLKSDEFLEKDLRLLFLVFLKPITNGIGFTFKEVETGAEKRLDIVVIFRDEKFIVELKIWYGIEYHKRGMERLKKYMEIESINKGYMLIMNKTREKEFTHEVDDGMLCVYI